MSYCSNEKKNDNVNVKQCCETITREVLKRWYKRDLVKTSNSNNYTENNNDESNNLNKKDFNDNDNDKDDISMILMFLDD